MKYFTFLLVILLCALQTSCTKGSGQHDDNNKKYYYTIIIPATTNVYYHVENYNIWGGRISFSDANGKFVVISGNYLLIEE